MKFKKGIRVEVLRRTEDASGSWFPAKIISKDGCKYRYTVRFEFFLTVEGDHVLEKVTEEDIRPCPPVIGEKRWVAGDIVEVFDLHSWRVGKVAKVLKNNYFVVRLFGSIQLKEFHISSLRVRQAWRDNQWFMIEKIDGNKQYEGHTRVSNEQDHMGTFFPAKTVKNTLNSHYNSFFADRVCQTGKKRESISCMGECHHLAKRPLTRKVDVVHFANDRAVQNYMSTRLIKPSKMDVERGNMKGHPMHSYSIPLQVIEENDECSVGSCSVHESPENPIWDSRKPPREIVSSFSDDAMPSCPSKLWENNLHTSKGELAADVHELELYAYRSTMVALYASGPLSWEQESLLTNLRLSLHISIEEHLFQLRHLLSS